MSRDSAPALRAAQSCWMYPRALASPPKEASVVNRSSWPPLRPVIVTDRSPPPAPRYRPNTTSSSSANRSGSPCGCKSYSSTPSAWSARSVSTGDEIFAARAPTACSMSPPGRMYSATPRARSVSRSRSEEHTSELQSRPHLVCRLLLEKKKLRLKPKHLEGDKHHQNVVDEHARV